MKRPNTCVACGHRNFRKAKRDGLRDGSVFWTCVQCHHGVEFTAEGYELPDAIKPSDGRQPAPMAAVTSELGVLPSRVDMERRILESLVGRPSGPGDTLDMLAQKAVEAQERLKGRLNSPDPKVREQAERDIRQAGVDFIMDTSFGGP
jgi:hypothetical protein